MITVNLKEIEKKAYRSTFQDGIWDIFLGLLLMNIALGTLLTDREVSQGMTMAILTASAVIIVVAFVTAKKRITIPRMGFVKFGPKRERKIWKSRITLLVSLLVGVVVFIVAFLLQSSSAAMQKMQLILPAAWVANSIIIFSLLAHYMDCRRLYLYGVLFALPVPVDMVIKHLTGFNLIALTLAVPATIMLVVGAILLATFLKHYPLSELGNINGKQ